MKLRISHIRFVLKRERCCLRVAHVFAAIDELLFLCVKAALSVYFSQLIHFSFFVSHLILLLFFFRLTSLNIN